MLQLGQIKDPITTLVEAVLGLVLGVPSTMMGVNLFEKKMGCKGVAGGGIRPVKTMVLGVVVVCLTTCLHYHPNQLWAVVARVLLLACPPSLYLRLAAQPTLAQGALLGFELAYTLFWLFKAS